MLALKASCVANFEQCLFEISKHLIILLTLYPYTVHNRALCRRAQRGGRAGVGQINQRFNAVVNGDYGLLVQLWTKDKELAKMKEDRRGRGNTASDISKKARQAVSLISKGFISKATNRMISHGVASLDDRVC